MMDNLGQSGFAEVDVHTESAPAAGRVEINPRNGQPLSTIFLSTSAGLDGRRGGRGL